MSSSLYFTHLKVPNLQTLHILLKSPHCDTSSKNIKCPFSQKCSAPIFFFLPKSYRFTCSGAPGASREHGKERVTLTSCRRSPSLQHWQATDPKVSKKHDFINTSSLKLLKSACVHAWGWAGGCRNRQTWMCTQEFIVTLSNWAMCSAPTHNIYGKYRDLLCH